MLVSKLDMGGEYDKTHRLFPRDRHADRQICLEAAEAHPWHRLSEGAQLLLR